MAVPKKRTSKSKKNSRKTTWMQKPAREAEKALSLAKLVLSGNYKNFYYPDFDKNKADKTTGSETI
jgi:large subunit ribosomal protein L32